MYRFSSRATDFPNAGIAQMMQYGSKYPDIISLGQGTPLFPTPDFIYEKVISEAKKNPLVGMYADTNVEILRNLKQSIALEMQKDYGFTPEFERLTVTVGGAGALFASIQALVEKGDEVIYFDPSYPLHLSQLHLAGITPVYVHLNEENGWAFDSEKLKSVITDRTKLIILTNPNNPTGTVLSQTQIQELIAIVLEHDLILLLDEAYYFLTYDKEICSPLQFKDVRNNIIVCRSFSKEYAMTGWRIGYAYAAPELIEKIHAINIFFSVCPPTISMVAATAALQDARGEAAMNAFKQKFIESRNVICKRVDRLPKLFSYHVPEGAYYIFAKYNGFDMSAMEFTKLLVDEAHVIMIPGDGMGPSGKGHVRMSFACDASIIHKAFDRIDEFAKKHNLL